MIVLLIGIALLLLGIRLKNKEMLDVAPYVIMAGVVLLVEPTPA